jgi:hypothetical protein
MPAGKQATISKFMEQLSQVEGFTVDLETLEKFASKIPASTGVKPTKHRDGPRAKTAYNVWCSTYWGPHCEAEYGRKLPLADVKFKDGDQKGEVKLSAHTDERKQMWTDFQETPQFQEMKSEIEAENEKLGKVPTKRKATKSDEIERLKKELEEERKKNTHSDSNSEEELVESKTEEVVESKTEVPESKTEVVESKTEVVESKTEVVESKTEVVESKTEVPESKTEVDEFDQMDTNGDGVVDREEFEAHIKEKEKKHETLDEQTRWVFEQFDKSTETTCFKAWIMINHHDTYGPQKKKRISSDELKEFKAQHHWADFCGKKYTQECDWFEYIPSM